MNEWRLELKRGVQVIDWTSGFGFPQPLQPPTASLLLLELLLVQ